MSFVLDEKKLVSEAAQELRGILDTYGIGTLVDRISALAGKLADGEVTIDSPLGITGQFNGNSFALKGTATIKLGGK